MAATLPTFPATFVTTYVAQGIAEDPLNEQRKIFRIFPKFGIFPIKNPKIWVPQSTIVIMKFHEGGRRDGGRIEGKIQRNNGGFAGPGFPPLLFNGTYQFSLNEVLQVYEGLIHVNLLATDGDGPPTVLRTQILYAVCQDADTIKFMLRESHIPDGSTTSAGDEPGTLPSIAAGAVVQGVMDRVR